MIYIIPRLSFDFIINTNQIGYQYKSIFDPTLTTIEEKIVIEKRDKD